jgi:hypothetical protein
MCKNAARHFVLAGMSVEERLRPDMPEQVRVDPQPGVLEDDCNDLLAQRIERFRRTTRAVQFSWPEGGVPVIRVCPR